MKRGYKSVLTVGCSIAALMSGPTFAQDGSAGVEPRSSIEEIVVTAQKREQNLQSVPVAVTALSAEDLVANRITNVRDLNAAAPNLTVRIQPGGVSNPSYTMRGIVSGATAPGADSGVAVYVDGVYIASSLGSVIDFADIERIEVLKGPQGTLFGRNSTGGAISIITRDPAGELKFHQELTLGNYAQVRAKTRVDTPQFGPVSVSATYVHSERNGDITNTGVGTAWDFSATTGGRWGTRVSPKYLGSQNSDSLALAAKLDLGSQFTATYKFDWSDGDFTPDAHAPLYTNFAALGPAFGGLLSAIVGNQPNPDFISPFVTERPKSTNNWIATPGHQRVTGHNLTLQLNVTDNFSVKDILARRTSRVGSSTQLDGLGGLVNVVPAIGGVGQPYVLLATRSEYNSTQWSNELQINLDTAFVTLTAGFVHFENRVHLTSDGLSFGLLPNFAYPARGTLPSNIHVDSDGAYAQAEVHVMPGLDIVAGLRQTWDKKSGMDNTVRGMPIEFTVKGDKLTWSAGVNYQVTPNIFLYGRYSTGYISGGQLATFTYEPETAKSWEGGIKADWLDRKLRTNLAIFDVKYQNLQLTTSGLNVGIPAAPQVLLNGGDSHAYGFEFESTAVPLRGLTLKANVGYTHFKFTRVNPILGTTENFLPAYRPKWTGNFSAQYDSDPVFRDGHLSFRLDANYQSRSNTASIALPDEFMKLSQIPPSWIVNGRIALADMDLSGVNTQIALWGRNLTDNKHIAYSLSQTFIGSATFERARTYGVDVIVDF